MSGPAPAIFALIDKIRIVKDEEAYASVLESLAPDNIKGPVRVAFVNAHALNMCHENRSFLAYLLECDYVFRDGVGMNILFRMLGRDPGLDMNGTDFIPKILDLYKGRDVALLGTDTPYLTRASEKISRQGVNSILMIDGFHEAEQYAQRLKEKPAPLTILAMGMPKQEQVASLIVSEVTTPNLIVCGGAILDFIGEKVTRAPEILRKSGMEWLYRLMQEPRRLFRRYMIGNFVFMGRAFRIMRAYRPVQGQKGRRPRALHVVRQYAPAIGGLETYVRNITAYQTAAGYECEVLTLNKVFHGKGGKLAAEEVIEGIKVRRVGYIGFRRFFLPLVSPFHFNRYDVVYVHNTDVFFDYVALVALLTSVKAFAITHGGFFHTDDFSLIKKLYFNTITRFSSLWYKGIFAVSGPDYAMFKKLNDRTVLLPNAIEPLADAICRGADFVYIGRLAEHKRVDRVIEMFARLRNDHKLAATLHIIGPEWDVKIASLEEIARKAGIAGDVVFHGETSHDDMKAIVSRCGYFLSASTYEGFGMSMVEAMSAGLVPFVEGNDSFRELVSAAGVGLSGEYGDAPAMAAAIAASLPAREEDRDKAAAFAARFSWVELVGKLTEHYEQAV